MVTARSGVFPMSSVIYDSANNETAPLILLTFSQNKGQLNPTSQLDSLNESYHSANITIRMNFSYDFKIV